MTFTIPTPPRRVWLRSFWLTLMLAAGTLLAAMRILMGPSPVWLWNALLVFVLLVAGTVSQRVRRLFYTAWGRAADKYARVASWLITRLCFVIVMVAAGAGSRMRMRASEAGLDEYASGWLERAGHPDSSTYRSQHLQGDSAEGWIRASLSWARDTGNLWFVALIPYLAILRQVETRQARSLGGNIYTLY